MRTPREAGFARAFPLAQKVRVDPMFERKSRYRCEWLKAGRDEAVLRCGVVSTSPVPTYKPCLPFLIIVFQHLDAMVVRGDDI